MPNLPRIYTFTSKCVNTSIIYSQNRNVDSFSTQQCLLVMTEKWRKCLDKGCISDTISTDLSKAFDCILYDLLIAKLAMYGFDNQSLRIIECFLSNRRQRTKINNGFSRYSEILYGVPQRSILCPFQYLYLWHIF